MVLITSASPFLCLMSSMIDYIPMKPLDKYVVIIVNILTPSRISIEFMMGNTILALDDLCYHRPLYCLPFNTNLSVFCVIPWVPCYPAFVLLYLGVLPSFTTSWCSATSHHHHSFMVLVLIPTGVPTSERCCLDSVLLATLLLWSYWSIVSFYVYGLMNHHSNIDRAT